MKALTYIQAIMIPVINFVFLNLPENKCFMYRGLDYKTFM